MKDLYITVIFQGFTRVMSMMGMNLKWQSPVKTIMVLDGDPLSFLGILICFE